MAQVSKSLPSLLPPGLVWPGCLTHPQTLSLPLFQFGLAAIPQKNVEWKSPPYGPIRDDAATASNTRGQVDEELDRRVSVSVAISRLPDSHLPTPLPADFRDVWSEL